MGKAEVGSVKHLNKQMKARGLTRLRWYCQVCERAMRDENAFKQHTLSESHVRNMMAVGADPRKVINEYSDQFLKDFIQLLRTGHGEKQVQINHFYQEYIARRDHVHMNSTRWSSLTELAKYLGRESICRVEENEKGIFISWIDTSPEALRRQEALRRKEAQDRGDEEWERRLLKAQIERAERAAQEKKKRKRAGGDAEADGDAGDAGSEIETDERQPSPPVDPAAVKLSFGFAKPEAPPPASAAAAAAVSAGDKTEPETATLKAIPSTAPAAKPLSLSLGAPAKPQPKNVFAAAKKKTALSGSDGSSKKKIEIPKKMSEAERIMKEEMERKRLRGGSAAGGQSKRPRS